MSRPFRKPKAGHQKPKRRKPKPMGSGGGSTAAGGMMSGIRSAFRSTVRGKEGGPDKPSPLSRAIDLALWAAIAGALVYFVANARCS